MDLLNDLETYGSRVDRIMEEVTDLLWQIPNTKELLKISGVGTITVLTFVAEVGDISRIKDAKALQKLAELAIVADSSGKHNGERDQLSGSQEIKVVRISAGNITH